MEQTTSAQLENLDSTKGREEKKAKRKRTAYLFFKRAFDLFSASLLFLILSPFILLLLFIKWVEDGHNPVYVSKRVGKDGKIFNFYKIRTMCYGAEKMQEELKAQGLNEADEPAFKMKKDPRVTKVGKFYRRFFLDEILQLLNVINGSMSVVGPRPPLPQEVERYEEKHLVKLSVKGGLLCLWQLQKNRYEFPFEEWIALDLEYIERQSVALDIKIILQGVWVIFAHHNGE